jgi:zinc transporter 1
LVDIVSCWPKCSGILFFTVLFIPVTLSVSTFFFMCFASFLWTEHGHGGHGHSHGGISHGGIGRSHTRLTQLVSTDDNENDETFNPPLGPTLAAAIGNNKGHDHSQPEPSASQMNMRGVFLHVLADALGSVIVIVSASVSKYSKFL